MGGKEVQRIKDEFSCLKLHPVYLEHEITITSEDSARVRDSELGQGIKALVFTDENDWVVVNVPANKKADLKKVTLFLKWSRKNIRMGTKEEVFEKTGCETGAVPPFGHKNAIKILVDRGVYDNVESDFNIGLRTKSVKIPTEEMKIVFDKIGAIEGDFVKTNSDKK